MVDATTLRDGVRWNTCARDLSYSKLSSAVTYRTVQGAVGRPLLQNIAPKTPDHFPKTSGMVFVGFETAFSYPEFTLLENFPQPYCTRIDAIHFLHTHTWTM